MQKITLILFLLFLMPAVVAQTSSVKKAQGSFDKAQEYLKSNDFEQAAALLEEAVKADPSFQFAFIQLADLSRRLKRYERAKANYTSAIALGGNPDPRMYYG